MWNQGYLLKANRNYYSDSKKKIATNMIAWYLYCTSNRWLILWHWIGKSQRWIKLYTDVTLKKLIKKFRENTWYWKLCKITAKWWYEMIVSNENLTKMIFYGILHKILSNKKLYQSRNSFNTHYENFLLLFIYKHINSQKNMKHYLCVIPV